MKKYIIHLASVAFGLATLMLVSQSASAKGKFLTELKLGPKGCEKTLNCKVEQTFRFRDPSGVTWESKKGNFTDGASIPPGIFQLLIGENFDKRYLKAAVIHDHYCKNRVRSWRATRRVFYHALIASGVRATRAGTMYFGVRIGGPRWNKLVVGEKCNGAKCIRMARQKTVENYRPAQYDKQSFSSVIERFEKLIEANPEMSLDEVDAIMDKEQAEDPFVKNKHIVRLNMRRPDHRRMLKKAKQKSE